MATYRTINQTKRWLATLTNPPVSHTDTGRNFRLGTTPEEAAERIKREVPRFAAAIKQANIRPD